MTQTIQAVYTIGVLNPVTPLKRVGENERVVVTVSKSGSPHPFANWTAKISDEDAELMRKVIEDEFERIEPDDWK